ncbi:MAG TPA: alkanal monooxygenase [Nitrosomonas nitrosa]|uniref:LLM class flavin-dependent oxidoreductase n=1 Tax=Nitrosomonas sp. TaxID=42353 RepID=UPI000EC995E7|nr:LLM class flavin-dependent oxidoreductase [Nitrosomonas sp.]GJL76347.1 MAG: hypothetical protein NMNS02_24530 [Nitrosomonas sp.]HBZ29148.1 alkanal monooxygenase [Nitrosomonas nitrosa]HNP52026.1 LLM class flavin-dependent oxidoreductase [Nitrosomonas nitrosa]
MPKIPQLSILDATPIGPDVTATQALQWTTEIAQLAEKLNYHRLWVVEHHGVCDIGCSTPAVLIAHLAEATHSLRIGSGGVMLPNHAPFVVAEQFRMLQGLYPGRIDLGVGRARGADPAITLALQRGQNQDNEFETELDDLRCFLDGDFPAGHRFENVRISLEVDSPPVYLLGSSLSSAKMAAERGLPFAFAHHLNPDASHASLAKYKNEFRNNEILKKPYAILTIAVVCADSFEEAQHAAMAAAIVRLRRAAMLRKSLIVSSDVLLFPQWTDIEQQLAEKELAGGWILIGNPEQILNGLMDLCHSTDADELMLTSIEYEGPSRMRTLQAVGKLVCRT